MTWAENNKWNLCVSASGLAGIPSEEEERASKRKNCNQFIICQRHDLHKFLSFVIRCYTRGYFYFKRKHFLVSALCSARHHSHSLRRRMALEKSEKEKYQNTWDRFRIVNSQRKCLPSGDKCAFSDLINLPFVLSFCWWPWGTGLGFWR